MELNRLIDAASNRAREAARCLEDLARFALNDQGLCAQAKAIRHELAAITPDTLLHRDTPGDVGTTLTHAHEASRSGLGDLVHASANRLTEALRSLEEVYKLDHPDRSAACKAMRYRAYELHRLLGLRWGAQAPRRWRVMVLLTQSLCARPWQDVAQACLDGGADAIQLREKDLDDAELLDRAGELVERCRAAGVAVIVNDRVDIALLAGAAGVHVGQRDLPVAPVRRLAGRGLIVGVSTSSLEEAQAARAHGADYVGVGPMFPSTTKLKPFLAGPETLRSVVAWGELPAVAIGGITPRNLPELVRAGVGAVAVSAAVLQAADPAQVVRTLKAMLPPAPGAPG